MLFDFSISRLQKDIKMKLCYPNLKTASYFTNVFNLKIAPNFTDISTMSFEIYSNHPLYNKFKKSMVIHVDTMGYFVIKSTPYVDDSDKSIKTINCESYETTLTGIPITLRGNESDNKSSTIQFYDPVNKEKSLLGIIELESGWTVRYVDPDLCIKVRTFDNIDKVSAYSLMLQNMSKAYKCYFVFDTENKYIYAYKSTTITAKTNINLTFYNLVKKMEIRENEDDLCAVLNITGSQGVGITNVNPLGTNDLYDFSYIMSHDYGMSSGLIAALTAWNTKRDAATFGYQTLTLQRQQLISQLTTAKTDLSVLKGGYKNIQEERSVLLSTPLDVTSQLAELKARETTNLTDTAAKETEIETLTANYDACVANIKAIATNLSVKNPENFTTEQQSELNNYIQLFSGSYTNENFVYTDDMSELDKIDLSNELLAQARETMEKLSQPCYEFSMEIINYLFLKDFEKFVQETQLGVAVNARTRDGRMIQPRLLKIEIDFNDLGATKFTFSDTLRLKDDILVFEEMYNETAKNASKVAVTASSWDAPIKNNFYTTVHDYMTGSLDLTTQDIMNASGQEIMIGSYGMICRKKLDSGNYDLHELRLVNNVIAFSNDNFATTKTAIGYIPWGDEIEYGVNAGVIIGEMFIGNRLLIVNEENTFRVDANGAELTNAKFTVSKGKNRIQLDPSVGMKIDQKIDGFEDQWKDLFYFDVTTEQLILDSVKLKSSNIGGWTTTSDALTSPTGDFIGSNGTGQLSLLRWNNSEAYFNGNVYANNLRNYYGEGSQNIFVDGTMAGPWLTKKTVEYDRLSDLCVNTLRADLVSTEYLEANYASIGALTADEARITGLEADCITVNKLATDNLLVFGGKIFVGDASDNTEIYSALTQISTEVTSYGLYLEADGGIYMDGGFGITLNGGMNGGYRSPVIIYKTTMVEDVTFNEAVYFKNGINIEADGSQYWGLTQDIDIGGVTLHVKNGLIVST